MINVPDPTQNLMQNLQFAQGINDFKAKQQEAERAAAMQAQLQSDIASLGNNAQPSDIANLMVKYPQLSEQFKRTYDVLDEQQKQSRINQASQVYAALLAGDKDAASNILKEQAAAYKNSGMDAEAKTLEDIAKWSEINPESAKTSTAMFLAAAMGQEEFIKAFSTLQDERRAQSEESRKQTLFPGEIKKQAADLGLTYAQAAKVAADTAKTGAETQKLALELEAYKQGSGSALGIDPEKRFQAEEKLRKEYSNQTKNFTDVQESYRRIESSENTAQGDLSLIFSFMKMLDPGSVVREGEFATAQNAAGVPSRVINIYNNLLNGERLTPGQRKGFRSQAKGLFGAAKKRESDIRSGLKKVVKNYGLNEDNVFLTPSPTTKETVIVDGNEYARPDNFTDEQWAAYKQSQGVE